MKRIYFASFALPMLMLACGGGGGTTAVGPTIYPPQPASWTALPGFTGSTPQGSAAFVLGTRALLVGGTDGNRVGAQTHQFDTATRTWAAKGDFPGGRRADASGFSVQGKGYVALGWTDGDALLKDVWAFDPGMETWTRKADFPGKGRVLPTTLVIGARVYLVGGGAGSVRHKDVWEFDPAADTWTRKQDFPGEAFMTAAGFVVGAKGYVGTGNLAGSAYAPTKTFWEYDPASDAWTRKADFPGAARAFALAFSLGNRGYMGLGVQTVTPPMALPVDVWAYEPATEAWTRCADLPGAGRGMAVGFAIGSEGYIGLGNDAAMQGLRDLWQFVPR